jgi:hypothetical protein
MGFEIFYRHAVPERDVLKVGGFSTDMPSVLGTDRYRSGFSTDMALVLGT